MVELTDWGDLLGNIPEDGSNLDESMVDVDNGYFTDDDNQFGLDDATHTQARHIRQEWSTQEGGLSIAIPSEIAIENEAQITENPQPEPEIDIDGLSAPDLFKQEKLVYISFDIETGGEYCGIVQISAQIFRVVNHNSTFESNIESEIFDEYVKPPDDAIWDPHACNVHGLSKDDERIEDADSIVEVWSRFNSFVERHVGRHQRAVLVAWNGKSCDMKWLYKICQAPHSFLQLHQSITYFMDPMEVIKHYKSCQLNKEKTLPRNVGTITPTDKKARSDHDVPFLKLSNGGLKAVPRGWYREAVVEIKSANNNRYFIQCTTWRDKKQVMFLHTKLVGPSIAHQVKRHVKGKRLRVDLSAPSIQKEYAQHFNAVDRNDSDSAHHTCSIRTNRWYRLLDRVVFSCYILVCEMAQDEECPFKNEWKKYLNSKSGREDFQIDLALALILYGIEYDWPDRSEPKPRWMRQTELKPCECEQCFFCKTGQTNGIYHNRVLRIYTSPDSGKKRKLDVKCDFERKSLKLERGKYCRQCRREKKQKKIIQEWDVVDVESQSVKSAGQDMIWFLIIR